MTAGEWQQRADDNERLRRLATSEMETARDELASCVADLSRTRADLLTLNERTSVELASLHAELAEARDTIARQKAYIERLRKQLSRPLRLLAKKVITRVRPGSGAKAAAVHGQ